ncbi:MAG TPA: aminodeoxychorismate synthase component I, partial [Anaerolineales bacterium]|nr:aminodeoxychorismate synthase component I [Anaerolineales bacterium]
MLIHEDGRWLHFTEPRQMIVAQRLDDVLPALQEIERLTKNKGWYAAGFLSYEAASAFDPALQTRAAAAFLDDPLSPCPHADPEEPGAGFPYLWFGLYAEPRALTLPRPEDPQEILSWNPTVDRETYESAIAQIKDYIAQGRTYQINYTMRLQSDFTSNPWGLFLRLAHRQNQHAAYIDVGRYVICSASPELFFQLEEGSVTCRPMKGTIKRGRTTFEDNQQSEWLQNSEKNRAENVMIVDMIRNDLGRIANIGSVRVPQLFEIERYPTLWQMTSTITARTEASITEILAALFPCASITGAPKVSTMKIIRELESTPRKIYTGSIGYFSAQRKAKFNVAIRTMLIDRRYRKAEYGVGGGILWDSTSTDEYEEALLKARVLTQPSSFSLLETMLWTPEEGFVLRERHLARMLDSAGYFDIPVTRHELEECLEHISSGFRTHQRVRLLLDLFGKLGFESEPFEPATNIKTLKVCLAKQPIDSRDVFLFHKTTQRLIYESRREGLEEFDDVLLYNESGDLTEFTIGNLVVELEDHLLTPPLSCGVLAGTFRAHLLESGQVIERPI